MTEKMDALLKAATQRRDNRSTTWVEKLGKEPLEFVLKLKAIKKKGEFVSMSAIKKILHEEFKVNPAPSEAVIRKYIEGAYDHFLPSDRI
jgi:hypothetical protein